MKNKEMKELKKKVRESNLSPEEKRTLSIQLKIREDLEYMVDQLADEFFDEEDRTIFHTFFKSSILEMENRTSIGNFIPHLEYFKKFLSKRDE